VCVARWKGGLAQDEADRKRGQLTRCTASQNLNGRSRALRGGGGNTSYLRAKAIFETPKGKRKQGITGLHLHQGRLLTMEGKCARGTIGGRDGIKTNGW